MTQCSAAARRYAPLVGNSPSPWRSAFPALDAVVHGRRLAYLDSASTSLKPQPVIDAVVRVFTH
jgi:selenocysteine lyase/cysteine desulfurase